MSYYGVYRKYINFDEVCRSNVQEIHDVQKVFLETTLCIFACFVKFYVFVLDEILVKGPKFVCKLIRVKNAQENIPKDHPRIL